MQCTSEYADEFRLQFLMRCYQIEEWNLIHGHYDLPFAVCSASKKRRIFAGHPDTMLFAGTFLVTRLPAPTIAFSPIETFDKIVTPEPIDAPSFTSVGSTFQSASVCKAPLTEVARGYESLMKVTPWPMNTLSSIVTPSQIKVWLEILQLLPTLAFFWISTNAPIFVLSPIWQPYRLTNFEILTF